MAFVVKDRVQETSTTTGTGTFTLAGATAGFSSFSVIGNANTTYYTITANADWEVGIGTYTSSGTTLSRDTVLASSNSNNLVDFPAGTKNVFVVYPAGRAVIVNGSTVEVPNSATLPVTAGGTGSSTATFSGANITSLNASSISTGTLDNARTTASSSNGASTIVARDASGDFSARTITGTVSVNAPIFYDSNNTGYYGDFASTSNMNVVQLLNGKWYPVNDGSGNSAEIYVRPDNNNTYIWRHIYGGTSTGFGVGVGGYGIYCNHLGADYSLIFSPSGFVTAPYSSRSSLFYDSNDTAYYLDPNSTSDSALRIRGGALHGPNVSWGKYLLVGGDGRQGYTNNADVASVCTTNGNLHLDSASGYETYINFYDGNLVNFGNGANSTVSTINTDGSHRAQIFYDYNNTAYYIDPASYFALLRGRVGPYAGSQSGNTSALEIQNNGGTGDSNLANITFHCQNYYGTSLHLRPDGYFGVGGWSASSWRWYTYLINGDMTAAGNVTAYSDPRLKIDIKPIQSALSIVEQLNGVKFKWIESSVIGHPGEYDYGVLANEVEKVLPELVSDSMHEAPEGDKYKTVAYDKFAPILIEAIKELTKYTTVLEQRISQLEART